MFKYLKPGELIKLRDNKIASRSKRPNNLLIMSPPLERPESEELATQIEANQMENVPCFVLSRFNARPHCVLTKKIFAVTPILSETQD